MNTVLSGSQRGSRVWLLGENQGSEGCRDALVTQGWPCPLDPVALRSTHHAAARRSREVWCCLEGASWAGAERRHQCMGHSGEAGVSRGIPWGVPACRAFGPSLRFLGFVLHSEQQNWLCCCPRPLESRRGRGQRTLSEAVPLRYTGCCHVLNVGFNYTVSARDTVELGVYLIRKIINNSQFIKLP